MRGGPYKPRLPRDRKLWPVVFSPPFYCPLPLTLLSACLLLLLPLQHSACLLFPSSVSSSRLAAYEGTYGWRHCTTLALFLSLVRLPLCERGSSFSSIAFGYRGINYCISPCPVGALPPFLYMPTRDRSRKTNSIFFKNFAYSRTSGSFYMSRCCLAARRGQYYLCIAFWYLSVLHRITIEIAIQRKSPKFRVRYAEGFYHLYT